MPLYNKATLFPFVTLIYNIIQSKHVNMLALMHHFIGLNLQPLNAFIKYVDNMLIYEMITQQKGRSVLCVQNMLPLISLFVTYKTQRMNT